MITRNDTVNPSKLSESIVSDIANFVDENGSLPDKRLVTVLDAFLSWHGIRGYTAQILNIVEATSAPSNSSTN